MRLLPVLIACCICSCAPKQDAPRSCVLITLDTTNPDALDVYGESPPVSSHRGGVGDRVGTEVSAEAIEWLNGREGEEPFFLWVHYFDPHAPYEAPAEFLQRAEGKPYLGEVAAMDAAIGPLLDRLRAEPDYEDFCPGDPQAAKFRRNIEKRQAELKSQRQGGN